MTFFLPNRHRLQTGAMERYDEGVQSFIDQPRCSRTGLFVLKTDCNELESRSRDSEDENEGSTRETDEIRERIFAVCRVRIEPHQEGGCSTGTHFTKAA
jgi:hypothetical protein